MSPFPVLAKVKLATSCVQVCSKAYCLQKQSAAAAPPSEPMSYMPRTPTTITPSSPWQTPTVPRLPWTMQSGCGFTTHPSHNYIYALLYGYKRCVSLFEYLGPHPSIEGKEGRLQNWIADLLDFLSCSIPGTMVIINQPMFLRKCS